MTHRLHLFWRACALCMLLLSASPFTAPFATFDLGDSPLDLSSEQAVKITVQDKSASTSLTTIPEPMSIVLPDRCLTAGGPSERTSRPAEGSNLHQILRL